MQLSLIIRGQHPPGDIAGHLRDDLELVRRADQLGFDVVWEVYREVSAKQPIQIVSAYRSPTTNAALRRRSRGVARFSQHILGKAMDFYDF